MIRSTLSPLVILSAMLVSQLTESAFASPKFSLDSHSIYAQGYIGVTTDYSIEMFGVDSTKDTVGTVVVTIVGSPEFQIKSSSTFQYYGDTKIDIGYSPTSLNAATAMVYITSTEFGTDSVMLHGNPLSHQPLILRQSQVGDTVFGNATSCGTMVIINPNANAIFLDSLALARSDSGASRLAAFSFAGLPKLPITLGAYDTLLVTICADGSKLGEGYTSAVLVVYYTDTDGIHDDGSSQFYVNKIIRCTELVSGGDFGTITTDSTTTQGFVIYNPTTTTITVDTSSITGPFRFASGIFPKSLAGYGYDTVRITFDPSLGYVVGYNQGYFVLNYSGFGDSNICTNGEYGLSASVNPPIEDTTVVNLFPDSAATFTITTSHTLALHLIEFKNNSTERVAISSVLIGGADSADFYFLHGLYADTIVAGGEDVNSLLVSNMAKPGVYTVELALTLQSGNTRQKRDQPTSLLSRHYTIIANRVAAGVGEAKPVTESIFAVSPNPAQNTFVVRLDNVREANVELFNILGQPLNRQNGLRIEYDAHAMDLRAGTYFVRATGRDLLGNAFVESRRIVIAR